MQAEGKIDQAVGAAQDLYGQAREAAQQATDVMQGAAREATRAVRQNSAGLERVLRSSINERPLATVAVVLGVGWFLGRLLHRS